MSDIETAILKEDYAAVQKLASDVLKQNPAKDTGRETRYYLGLSLLRQNQYTQASDIFRELTRERLDPPLRDKVFLGFFDSYYMDSQYEQALEIGQQMLKKNPRSEFMSLMYLKMARVDLKLTQWEEASIYLKKIISEFPQSLEVHVAKQLLEEKQYFAVQVGAFMDRDRAQQLVDELVKKGEYAYIVETINQENTKFYRVRVGQMTLLQDAQQLKNKIASLGYPATIYP